MSIKIPTIKFEAQKVPKELREKRQWICWYYESKDGKLTKIPTAPWKTGHNGGADVTDPNNMTSFETSVENAQKHSWGIGFCFFSGVGLVGIDFDEITQESSELIKEANSYSERSPSGKGFHIIGYGKIDQAIKKKDVEVYGRDRFFTVTGDHIEGTPLKISNIQVVLDNLQNKYCIKSKPEKTNIDWENHVNQKGHTLRGVSKKDKKLKSLLEEAIPDGYLSTSEADMGTLSRLKYWSYTDEESKAIVKYFRPREKLNRSDYLDRTLEKLSTSAKPKDQEKGSSAVKQDEDMMFELENQIIQPMFSGISKSLHPAIGIVDNIGYLGLHLPSRITNKKTGEMIEREVPFLVTSLHETIPLQENYLNSRKWRSTCELARFKSRWDILQIQKFAEKETPDFKELYKRLKTTIQEYIELDSPAIYDLLALWIAGTYFFTLFSSYPYIYLNGVKRTGKTKVLTIADLLCFNPIFSANISTSSLFRLIQSSRCTALMDETEGLGNPDRKQDFRSLLLSGYKKGMYVFRTEKNAREKQVPQPFEVYSPKMIANIQGIEDVLEDRCITIIMRRGKDRKIINSEPDQTNPIWQELRDLLHPFFLTYWQQALEIYQNFGEGYVRTEGSVAAGMDCINARDLELWKPILTMAKLFDSLHSPGSQPSEPTLPTLCQIMSELAKKKTEEKQTENCSETREYILVKTLDDNVVADDYYKVKEIKDWMQANYGEDQKWLTAEWLGRALKRLGLTDKRRVGTGIEYQLTQIGIHDLSERMGIESTIGAINEEKGETKTPPSPLNNECKK